MNQSELVLESLSEKRKARIMKNIPLSTSFIRKNTSILWELRLKRSRLAPFVCNKFQDRSFLCFAVTIFIDIVLKDGHLILVLFVGITNSLQS